MGTILGTSWKAGPSRFDLRILVHPWVRERHTLHLSQAVTGDGVLIGTLIRVLVWSTDNNALWFCLQHRGEWALVDIESILTETKSLDTAPDWFVSTDDTANFDLERTPLSVNGITVPGIYLTGHCRRFEPDLDVSFSIICNIPKLYKGPLIRYDWNPKQTHNNKGRGKLAYKFRIFKETHIHPSNENFALGYKIMHKDNLPIAYPVSPMVTRQH